LLKRWSEVYREKTCSARKRKDSYRWFLEAAERGNPYAQFNLGACTRTATAWRATRRKPSTGWAKRPARHRLRPEHLGAMYYYGRGVEPMMTGGALVPLRGAAGRGLGPAKSRTDVPQGTRAGAQRRAGVRLVLPRRRGGLASAQTLLGECYAEGSACRATTRWRWRGIARRRCNTIRMPSCASA
jgi:TPR repeat protein